MVDFSGSLVGGTLPVALLMFGGAGHTGTLSLWGKEGAARFLFGGGRMVYARMEAGSRLGDALVEKGLIKEVDLNKVLHLQGRKKVKQPLGVLLHSFGLISREVAEKEIEEQMLRVMAEVMTWSRCNYRFEPLETELADLIIPDCGDVDTLLDRLEQYQQEAAAELAAKREAQAQDEPDGDGAGDDAASEED